MPKNLPTKSSSGPAMGSGVYAGDSSQLKGEAKVAPGWNATNTTTPHTVKAPPTGGLGGKDSK